MSSRQSSTLLDTPRVYNGAKRSPRQSQTVPDTPRRCQTLADSLRRCQEVCQTFFDVARHSQISTTLTRGLPDSLRRC
ncbi:hypothetical protein DPMN_090633 [Dreissena polymorpha]|uniref:Uncharacterized protein n=1 Tax=Dreissena polymorpha TaxID=45954 RepID=A0A9D4KYZ7_DREPO|nr:hypothetical protein DPMN_090633 [Dreissena polymorpha]